VPYSGVSLRDLIEAGLLDASARLVWDRPNRGETVRATVVGDGWVRISGGQKFRTPSGAARAAVGGSHVDGWRAWRVGTSDGPTLGDLRVAYLREGRQGRKAR
jgi:Restriction Enzyme Adenine Methylase Associated